MIFEIDRQQPNRQLDHSTTLQLENTIVIGRRKEMFKQPNLEVGDIVLEVNKGFIRGEWSICHVAKVFPGEDGCVRAVDVQLPTGIFRQGITELNLLESSSSVKMDLAEDGSPKHCLTLQIAERKCSLLLALLQLRVLTIVSLFFEKCNNNNLPHQPGIVTRVQANKTVQQSWG
ncbi:hypothetical protein OUZ56_032745 [Daphnia magna]|uniref:DUF5641 domain-containing protein n=1 Tax=Daphnia magna TaxID=35525 RepID=A0ABQ9ZWZ9_9CRUS|nr:hypothetical protein OUZ56_032745 [Daphnia magna]